MNQRELRPTDVLFIPRPRRLLHETLVSADGQRALTLFYGETEVTFDDPSLIPFGERLLETHRFVAEQALRWGAGGYSWETVQELCEALLREGILQLEEPASVAAARSDAPARDWVEGSGSIAGARAWTPDACLSLSSEIFRVPIEVGNLESLVRCVRIAHSALDVGGRQIGEKNVFPVEMQLDLPTKLRTCPYRGSRFEHALPMNVTGLEPVLSCWRDIMHNVRALKREYFRRRPAAREGLTVVDLYVLGTIALCVPAFLMHRAKDAVENGRLPLEASALFRVMDGVRMTPRNMLTHLHPSYGPDVAPTAEQFYQYADRKLLLIADRGVCAGPPQMIETFLELVMARDSEVEPLMATEASRIDDLEPAVSYGLAAGALEAIADQFWLRHAAIVRRLLAHLAERPQKNAVEQALQTRLEASLAPEVDPYPIIPAEASLEHVYGNLSCVITRCAQLGSGSGQPSIPPFDDGVEVTDVEVAAVHAALGRDLAELPTDTALELALAIVRLRQAEEQTFPRMAERQAACNAILGRSPPSRKWCELDMATAWPLAHLRAALSEAIGITLGPRGERPFTVSRRGAPG